MRSILGVAFLFTSIGIACAERCRADVATLSPVADAFVASASPNSNYGAAGALAISAPGLSHGEFQSVMRFDTTAAVAGFNSSYGAGNWTIQSITLQLTAATPNNAIFNAQAAGQFAVRWMQNDSWSQGSGTPMSPSSSGITFSTLPSFLGASDEALGTFSFNGATSGAKTYSLALTSGFTTDTSTGGLVSFQLLAADSVVSYVSNAQEFINSGNRPELVITAVPAPAAGGLLLAGIASFARRSRRRR